MSERARSERVSITVDGAADWKPRLVDDGNDDGSDLQLRYTCPTCGMANLLNVQPLPWSAPDGDELTEGPDGLVGVRDNRRRAGSVKHIDRDEIVTQLWCHRCGQGADATLRSS